MSLRQLKKVYVEITTVCNLRCSFCPPTRRPAAQITLSNFRRIVTQVASITRHIHLHVKGEPLLHPDLAALLDEVEKAGLQAHIVTNGTLLDRQEALLLGHPALRQVNISLHSFERGDPEPYLAPVVRFARKAAAAGRPIISLRFWTGPESPLVREVAREFAWEVPEDLKTTPTRGFRLAPNLFVNFDREFEWPSPTAPVRSELGFCLGLRDQLAILVDGTVVPCCLDGEGVISLGNLYTQDLTAILASPRAIALSQGFSENHCVEDLCQRCGFRERFNKES